MAIRAKEQKISIVIKAKDSFSATFNKAGSLAKSTGAVITKSFKMATVAVAGTGAAFVAAQGAVVAFAGSVAKADDTIGKMAMRIGSTTEALSEYQHVAELSGITAQTLGTAWQRQARRISQAAEGTGEAVKALKKLNLSADDLKDLAPEDQFEMIADAMLKVENQGDKMAAAMQIWDTEGVSLLQTMEGGSAGLREMREEARKLGLSMSGEEAQAAAEYNDAWARLMATFRGLKRSIAHEILPQITQSFITIKEKFIEFLPVIKNVMTTAVTVILNFPKSLALAAEAVRKIYARITADAGDSASQTVVLFVSAFQTLGPAIGSVMIEISRVVFEPLFAGFKATMQNIGNWAQNKWREIRIESQKEFIENPGPFGSPELVEAAKKTIKKLEGEISSSYVDVGEAAKNALGDTLSTLELDFSGVKLGFDKLITAMGSLWDAAKDDPALRELYQRITALRDVATEAAASVAAGVYAEEGPGVASFKKTEQIGEEEDSIFFAPSVLETEQSRILGHDSFMRGIFSGFLEFETGLTQQRLAIQQQAMDQGIAMSNLEAQTFAINAYKKGEASTAMAGITGAANKSMETQMLSMIETGKFSAEEFGKVVVQQTKMELVGISARAAVQALFQTGMGLAALATYRPTAAANHFAAAGQFAAIAGVAFAGAATVHNATSGGVIDGSTTTSTATGDSGTGADGSDTTAPILADTQQAQAGSNVTIQIMNPLGNEDWDKITREMILPALNRGGSDNFTIDSTVIAAV